MDSFFPFFWLLIRQKLDSGYLIDDVYTCIYTIPECSSVEAFEMVTQKDV